MAWWIVRKMGGRDCGLYVSHSFIEIEGADSSIQILMEFTRARESVQP